MEEKDINIYTLLDMVSHFKERRQYLQIQIVDERVKNPKELNNMKKSVF